MMRTMNSITTHTYTMNRMVRSITLSTVRERTVRERTVRRVRLQHLYINLSTNNVIYMRFYDFLSVTDSLCAHIFFCVLIMNQGAAQGHLDCLYQNPKLTYKNTHTLISGLGIGRTFLWQFWTDGRTDGQTKKQ